MTTTIGGSYPAVNSDSDATINGLTVGKGGGSQSFNTALGYQSLNNASNGNNGQVGVGYQALYSNTTGSGIAVGYRSLYANTSGSNNTAIGESTLTANTTGGRNVGIGDLALQNNTTASNNTAVGYTALYSNTTGATNTAVGYQAAYSNVTGASITAVGYKSLYAATGNNNTAIGKEAGLSTTTGTSNSFLGAFAGYANTTGANNVAIGLEALQANTTASNNTAVGYQAGYGITTGIYNTILGSQNTTLTTGEYNIQIGRFANASASSVSYALMINTDNTARTDKGSSTGFIFTGGGMFQGNNSASWSTTSDQRLKKNIVDNTDGLAKITAIQVRNFEYRTADEITDLPKDQAVEVKGIQLGAIAQEIQAILPECVKIESTGVMSVDTTNLTWYLINAVKELNAKITALENK